MCKTECIKAYRVGAFPKLFDNAVGIFRCARDNGHRGNRSVVDDDSSAVFQVRESAQSLEPFKGKNDIRFTLINNRGMDAFAVFNIGDNTAASLTHAVNLGHLYIKSSCNNHVA